MDYYKLKVLNNKKKITIIIILIIIIISLVYYFFYYKEEKDNIVLNNEENIISNEKELNNLDTIYIDIKGYVEKPGVYSFRQDENARINDLIIKAGGLKKDADTSTINLSKKLEDEMSIVIYSKNEIANFVKTQDELRKKLEICEVKIKNSACIKEENNNKNSNNKININEATLEELTKINGIGENKAKAIIEYRKKNKFKSINDIMNVEGIGESLFATIKESITV